MVASDCQELLTKLQDVWKEMRVSDGPSLSPEVPQLLQEVQTRPVRMK